MTAEEVLVGLTGSQAEGLTSGYVPRLVRRTRMVNSCPPFCDQLPLNPVLVATAQPFCSRICSAKSAKSLISHPQSKRTSTLA